MKAYPLAAAALLVLLFAVNLYRAVTQPWPVLFQAYDANHHVLNTILEKIATASPDSRPCLSGCPASSAARSTSGPCSA